MAADGPVGPAEVLIEEFLAPHGLSPGALAAALRVAPERITALVEGVEPVSADLALRLGRFLGTTPRFWLNLQHSFDLARARESVPLARIEPLRRG